MGLGIIFLFPVLFLFRVTLPQSRFVSDIFIKSVHHNASNQHSSDYAYAWVLDGVREDEPGFVWKILTSANSLRREGSEADFWLFAPLSSNSTLKDLPDEANRMFRALNVNIILLNKSRKQSFTQLVYDKFLKLKIIDYKRVMFLDVNMMPMINLDYIFLLSDPDYLDAPTLLKPNLIMATRGEPCNTGMFMVEPSQRNFENYFNTVTRRLRTTKTFPCHYFDRNEGCGSKEMADLSEAMNIRNRKQWRRHARHSDKGLMYMYAKYILGDVSIAVGDRVQNWRRERDEGLPVKELDVRELLSPFQGKLLQCQNSCANVDRREDHFWRCNPPYDFTAHFIGKEELWLGQQVKDATTTHGQYGVRGQWFP